ncbi:unnamed protein product [Ixodes pacificus]
MDSARSPNFAVGDASEPECRDRRSRRHFRTSPSCTGRTHPEDVIRLFPSHCHFAPTKSPQPTSESVPACRELSDRVPLHVGGSIVGRGVKLYNSVLCKKKRKAVMNAFCLLVVLSFRVF